MCTVLGMPGKPHRVLLPAHLRPVWHPGSRHIPLDGCAPRRVRSGRAQFCRQKRWVFGAEDHPVLTAHWPDAGVRAGARATCLPPRRVLPKSAARARVTPTPPTVPGLCALLISPPKLFPGMAFWEQKRGWGLPSDPHTAGSGATSQEKAQQAPQSMRAGALGHLPWYPGPCRPPRLRTQRRRKPCTLSSAGRAEWLSPRRGVGVGTLGESSPPTQPAGVAV